THTHTLSLHDALPIFDRASADMARMIPIAIDSFPTTGGITRDQIRAIGLAPNPKFLKDAVVRDVGDTLWVLMGTIGLVLLIADRSEEHTSELQSRRDL